MDTSEVCLHLELTGYLRTFLMFHENVQAAAGRRAAGQNASRLILHVCCLIGRAYALYLCHPS